MNKWESTWAVYPPLKVSKEIIPRRNFTRRIVFFIILLKRVFAIFLDKLFKIPGTNLNPSSNYKLLNFIYPFTTNHHVDHFMKLEWYPNFPEDVNRKGMEIWKEIISTYLWLNLHVQEHFTHFKTVLATFWPYWSACKITLLFTLINEINFYTTLTTTAVN